MDYSNGDVGDDVGIKDCVVTFDTPSILDAFENDAEYTFTEPAYKWWEQRCGKGRLVLESTFYNHYHLGYEDPEIDLCFNITGNFDNSDYSRPDPDDPTNCLPINPVQEPRDLALHWGNDILVIRRLDDNDEPMVRQ